ncbi:hypothetical protein Gpo141_00003904 [Globisporangium polare]
MMRVRLRAPDEDADVLITAATTTATTGASAWPSAHHRELHALNTTPARRLPPLDVRSPEYIEERLENLKRKPSWLSWLDQYVLEHPESDSENEDGQDSVRGQRVEIDCTAKPKCATRPGFLKTTLWSVAIVAFSPLLVLLYPCLRNRGNWPLGCTSLPRLIVHAIATLVFILFGVTLVYWTICRELPELHANAWRTNVEVRLSEMLQSAEVCRVSVFQWEGRALVQELCMPVAIDAALLLLNVWLVFQSHRRWVRYALVLMAALFYVDMPAKLYQATFPAPDVVQIDPSYALVDEEILIALEGKNLKPGGSLAWVAYWGCASTASVDSCEKQFHATFDMGVVSVTFTSIDHFIPCYRDPPNPLKAQEFKCFEHIRLRVKDKQSIPGWSKVTGLQQQAGGDGKRSATTTGEQRIETSAHHKSDNGRAQKPRSTSGKKAKQTKRAKVKTVSVEARGEIAQE